MTFVKTPQHYSQSRHLLIATSCSQNAAGRNDPQRPFLPVAPIHNLLDIFQWNSGIVPVKL